MDWNVSKLDVDFASRQVTLILDSLPDRTQRVTVNFVTADGLALKPHTDDVTKAALLAQAKQILADAANSR